MPVIDVPQPAFMEEEEIAIFADAVGKFYAQHAPQKRVEKWREDGMVEREFWREAGAAGLLGVSVPVEYGGHGGDFVCRAEPLQRRVGRLRAADPMAGRRCRRRVPDRPR